MVTNSQYFGQIDRIKGATEAARQFRECCAEKGNMRFD
jgi:hypothetical protein